MSDTFWCRGCQQHKKVCVRHASQKIGGALCCNHCSERMVKRMAPIQAVTRDGLAFSIKSEHLRTSAIKRANRNPAEVVKNLLAYCPAD